MTALSQRQFDHLLDHFARKPTIGLSLRRYLRRRNFAQSLPIWSPDLKDDRVIRFDKPTTQRIKKRHGIGTAFEEQTKPRLALEQRGFRGFSFRHVAGHEDKYWSALALNDRRVDLERDFRSVASLSDPFEAIVAVF